MTEPGKREDVQLGRALRLDRRRALELLRDLGRDRAVLADLRRLWARETGATTLCFASDEQVLAQLADLVASGSLAVARVHHTMPRVRYPVEGEAEAPPPAEEPAAEKSWIELHVVHAETGAPVAGVALQITPASGSEAEHTTDAKGKVRLDGIAKGPCVVRCKLADVVREDALLFMGSSSGAPAAPAETGEKKEEKKGGPPQIVRIVEHKVRTGDTLDSIAKSVGSTWKKVAKFNWGTDDPKQINKFLRTAVGSTKKSKDGKNYIFDDSDRPGIILLPSEWKAEGMDAGHAYTIEVIPALESKAWIFSQ